MVLNFEKIYFSPTMGQISFTGLFKTSVCPRGRIFRDLLTKILRMRIIRNILRVFVFWFITLTGTAHEIHHAALMGDIVKLKMILEIDPQLVHARNNYGNTPLHCAAFYGREKAAEFLLDKGADINARNNKGKTPLFCAVAGGKKELVDLLLSNGADVNAKDNENNTPLHYAVSKTCLKIIHKLLENKANVSLRNLQGKTPLKMAIENGYKDIIEILIASEMDSCNYEFSDQSDNIVIGKYHLIHSNDIGWNRKYQSLPGFTTAEVRW